MKNTIKKITLAASLVALPFIVSAADSQGGSLMMAATTAVSSAEITGSVPEKLSVSNANVFNRLLKKEKDPNAAPPDDGYHDPANDATTALQPPKVAYEGLPTTEFGNRVDWVKALDSGKLNPRYDRQDPDVEPFVMDLDIVRPVKASVPDVVFPHKPHTQWLHCSNCHPKIFVPQRLSNQINMSAIILGQKCGVCHGKVSFPPTTKSCKKCHSKEKPANWKPPLSEASVKNPWR
ncbi:MAG: cytochrome c, class I [Gammaproteobacteria bacterium]|nr:cytochrome c, class I [Gammaproteobacteria bacterium]MDH5729241.1 cytochrome c, class I [Gammaproteobacteria bacterium]